MKTKFVGSLAAVGIAVLLGGCAVTKQAKETTTSGFLDDYSKLQKGGEDEALLVYRNPKADLAKYKSILMDPIRVYASDESALRKAAPEELKAIVDYLDEAVRTQLTNDYALVKSPGPQTMRLRIAITEAQGSKRVLDTMSSVLPPGIAISLLKNAITGKPTGVGTARVEMDLSDSESNGSLMAAVDERVGGKAAEGKFDKWDDVQKAFDHWAARLKDRLAQERAKK